MAQGGNKFGTKDYNKSPEKRLLALAAEIAESKDVLVPRLLLKLEGILECYSPGSAQLKGLKEAIYGYDLLPMLLASLKQDFSKMPEGWKNAARLANLTSQCCIGLDVAKADDFQNRVLSNVLQLELLLSKKLQNRYIKTPDVLEDTKNDLMQHYKAVLDSICVLYSGHEVIADRYMTSPILMQMFMSDDVNTSVLVMGSVQSVNRLKPDVMKGLGEKLYQQIMDELIFKLSAASNSDVANAATRTVLVICDAYPSTVQFLCTRYKGLKLLLNKWQSRGFERDLRRLLMLLNAGSLQQAEMVRLHVAAGCIQAFWRSYSIRKKLSSADRAIGQFHRSFRAKKELERRKREEQKKQKELKDWLMLERKRTMRELRFRQLRAIELIPASDVEKHMRKEMDDAAVCIQRRWRGYRVRAGIPQRKTRMQRLRAAVRIQRAVRKWQEKSRQKKKEPPNWQRPPGLTDERRVELLERINHHREQNEVQTVGPEKREELHNRVQAMLKNHAIGSKKRRKDEMHRNALFARLETDAELLIPCPKLSEMKASDLQSFVCHSVPIASKARYNHNEELRLLRQPWWKKLGDEYQDSRYEEDNTVTDWKVF